METVESIIYCIRHIASGSTVHWITPLDFSDCSTNMTFIAIITNVKIPLVGLSIISKSTCATCIGNLSLPES